MYHILILAVIALLPLSVVSAQKPNTPPAGFLARVSNGANRPIPPDPFLVGITVSAEQKSQITAIHAKYRALMKERLDSTYANARAKKLKAFTPILQDLQDRHVAELRMVIPDVQRPTFDKNVQNIKAEKKNMRKSVQSGTPPTQRNR